MLPPPRRGRDFVALQVDSRLRFLFSCRYQINLPDSDFVFVKTVPASRDLFDLRSQGGIQLNPALILIAHLACWGVVILIARFWSIVFSFGRFKLGLSILSNGVSRVSGIFMCFDIGSSSVFFAWDLGGFLQKYSQYRVGFWCEAFYGLAKVFNVRTFWELLVLGRAWLESSEPRLAVFYFCKHFGVFDLMWLCCNLC